MDLNRSQDMERSKDDIHHTLCMLTEFTLDALHNHYGSDK